jgi:hypothetical protein
MVSQTIQHSISHRLPNTHINPSTQLSSTQPAQPKRMDPPLLYHVVPQAFLLLPGIQCSWSRISMLALLGIAAVKKYGHMPNHLRHVGLKSWLDYTSNIYIQQYLGFSSVVHLTLPIQDTKMRKDEWVKEMNGVRSPQNV